MSVRSLRRLAAHAGFLEGGHLAEKAAGSLQQRPGQHGVAAFTETQVQLQQRCGEQTVLQQLMTAFVGTMAVHVIVAYRWREPHRFQTYYAGDDDDSVDHD